MWVDRHRIEMTITRCPELLCLVTPLHACGKTDGEGWPLHGRMAC